MRNITKSMPTGFDLIEEQIAEVEASGGSQRDYARDVGVDESVISRLRHRDRLPSLELAITLEERKKIPTASWKNASRQLRRPRGAARAS